MKAEITGGEIRLFDCYMIKESVKEIAGRYFDSDGKCWVIPNSESNLALIKILGFDVSGEQECDCTQMPIKDEPPIVSMPIKATPYRHQIAAYNFALRVLGGAA